MSQLAIYACDVCGARTGDHHGWFTLSGEGAQMEIASWDEDGARAAGVRHACSAEHVEKLVFATLARTSGPVVPLPLNRGGWDPAALQAEAEAPESMTTEDALLSVLEAIDVVLQSPSGDEEEALAFDA